MLAPPPGGAYKFILNVISYPLAVVNVFVAAGLLYLYYNPQVYGGCFRASWLVTTLFFLSNVYLVVAPFIPPSDGQKVYGHLPYYLHCVVVLAITAAGGVYWIVWAKILSQIGKYDMVRKTTVSEYDGWEESRFSRRKIGERRQGRESVSTSVSEMK